MACLNGRVKTIEQRRGEPSRAIPSVTLSPCLFLSASTSHAEADGRSRHRLPMSLGHVLS